jgi:hypothetical protein
MSKTEKLLQLQWKPFLMGAALIAVLALLIWGGCSLFLKNGDEYKPNGTQAVFLTNGQVYFGTIQSKTDKEVILTGIYYLQSDRGVNTGANLETQQDIKLIKLGNELHGPEDYMELNRDHILFIENLKQDSKVVKAIQNFAK